MLEGNPWFVAKDAACVLFDPHHIHIYGVSARTGHLNKDEKRILNHKTLVSLNLIAGDAKTPSMSLISESGLYKLSMRSDRPEAKVFQDWVTREVLPSIRKTGTYTMPGGVPRSDRGRCQDPYYVSQSDCGRCSPTLRYSAGRSTTNVPTTRIKRSAPRPSSPRSSTSRTIRCGWSRSRATRGSPPPMCARRWILCTRPALSQTLTV
ncbi:BRO family protein [Cereibacter johrii]|uniref:BRO-N domain-containing protein n=1 Tax=Cereibacter johrii TaxID=445629 RepID=UPI002B25822D|nr:BRO family protein [Cereibacter johrii]MEA5163385.1 BRO family protein [Cereibacter johrii]